MPKRDYSSYVAAYRIPLGQEFCTLRSDVVCRIVDAAKAAGYRKPKNANGSTGRYFYALLNRRA